MESPVTFGWPWMLLGMFGAAIVAIGYAELVRRETRFATVYSDLATIRSAIGPQARRNRHLPMALLLTSLIAATIGAARPAWHQSVLANDTTVVLAIDVSRSMCATDIEPNRLATAQAAAISFVRAQTSTARVGLVAFAGSAELVVPPTRDADAIESAITGLTTSFGTGIGSAILRSVDAIADANPAVEPTDTTTNTTTDKEPSPGADRELDSRSAGPSSAHTGLVPDVVVVLTDGANTQGIDPLRAADASSVRGVRVFAIGFGTSEPTVMVCSPGQDGVVAFADPTLDPTGGGGFVDFGAGAGSTVRQALEIDEPTLEAIAEITGGGYYRASDRAELERTFAELPERFVAGEEPIEIAAVFSLAAGLLAICAAAAAIRLRWS